METNQDSGMGWYATVIVVIIIALGAWWYFSSMKAQAPVTPTDSSAIENTSSTPVVSAGNTTADIQADLEQTADGSAALDQQAAASAKAVEGF